MLQLLSNLAEVTTYTYTTSTAASSGPGAAFWIAYLIVVVAVYVFTSYVVGRVFMKAGRDMWPAFVPFYNSWVLLELGGQKGANVFWVFLPFVGSLVYLYFFVVASLELGRRFAKSTAFSVFGLIIFSIVGYIMLAFDKSVYQDPSAVSQGPTGPTGFAPVAPAAAATPAAPVTPEMPAAPVQAPEAPSNEQPPQQQPPVSPIV